MFYRDTDIIIDPGYPDLASYSSKYDYDLLGHPIGLGREFWRNPVGYLRGILNTHKTGLFFSFAFCIAILLGYLGIKAVSRNFLHYLKSFLAFYSDSKSAKGQNKKRKLYGLPYKPDLDALAFYRTFARHYEIHSANSKIQLPEDADDHEALRFPLEAAYPTGLGFLALDEDWSPTAIDKEPIEGKVQDEVLEQYLREVQARIAKEKARYGYRSDIEEPTSRKVEAKKMIHEIPSTQILEPPKSTNGQKANDSWDEEGGSLSDDDYEDDDYFSIFEYDEGAEEWGTVYHHRPSSSNFTYDEDAQRGLNEEYKDAVRQMYEGESLDGDELPLLWRQALGQMDHEETMGHTALQRDYHDARLHREQANTSDGTELHRDVKQARLRMREENSRQQNRHNQNCSVSKGRTLVNADVHEPSEQPIFAEHIELDDTLKKRR